MHRSATAPFLFVRFLFGLLEALLIARFGFVFLGANPANPLVRELYAITGPLVAVFRSIVPSSVIGGFTVEWSTLIAMAAYALLAFGLIRLLDMFVFLAEGESDEHIHHRHHHA